MQITLEIPEDFGRDTLPELEKQIKLEVGIALFHAGKISSGRACEFAGIDLVTAFTKNALNAIFRWLTTTLANSKRSWNICVVHDLLTNNFADSLRIAFV